MNAEAHSEQNPRKHLLLPALLLGIFLVYTFTVILSTNLVDIATSLKVSIGTASQFITVAKILGLIIGIAMGFLTIRFKHKTLFLIGTAIYGLGALGSFFAPDFLTMLAFQVFFGIGSAMVNITVFALIGEFVPLQKRGWAVGLTWSISFSAYVFVSPLSSFVSVAAGWRYMLLWFILPFSIICLVIGALVIPSKEQHKEQPQTRPNYLQAFKQILSSRSAMACVVSTALAALVATIPTYAVSFYRLFFNTAPSTAALFSSLAAVGGIIGGAGAGTLINRRGRKFLTVVSAFISGIFGILITFVPNVWISVAFWALCASILGMTWAALYSLVLEQVPDFKGSMMSVNHIFRNMGLILGVAIGGAVLNLFFNNFQILMTIFGASGIALGLIILLFATDPYKTK
ncbi:MAG TPA: MFS transporter [Candidatus Nanoarchaeia archaeon]|nr:MFS transporter [Candidatus Nanoarchaeia archaeon]